MFEIVKRNVGWLIYGASFLVIVTACNPSPKLKAAMADEEIREEVCSIVFPEGVDGRPAVTYAKNDTPETRAEIASLLRQFTAYCS